jgi:uncharacterized membrane protein YphA (DoxX/SURF4 family)
MTESKHRVFTGLAVLLGLLMIAGGATKLLGQSAQVVAFKAWGLPPWFRALVGTFEVIGGTFLVVPLSRPFGSFILSTIMVGALWAHAAHGEWPSLIPPAALLTLFLMILRRNREGAIRLLGSM